MAERVGSAAFSEVSHMRGVGTSEEGAASQRGDTRLRCCRRSSWSPAASSFVSAASWRKGLALCLLALAAANGGRGVDAFFVGSSSYSFEPRGGGISPRAGGTRWRSAVSSSVSRSGTSLPRGEFPQSLSEYERAKEILGGGVGGVGFGPRIPGEGTSKRPSGVPVLFPKRRDVAAAASFDLYCSILGDKGR